MTAAVKLNKAKAAQRVVEVLEFFDEQHRQATVMDIVRRYNRPQSSTSELLASLVDLGLLYKDPRSRSYTLTPRAAILGSLSQPRLVRDGRLGLMIDELAARTGHGVALVGLAGLNAQTYRWKAPARWRGRAVTDAIAGGAQARLCDTAAGWLLLATMPTPRREGLLRRLNAEAAESERFVLAEMNARVREASARGHATGPAGFGTDAAMCAVLLPAETGEHAMALGLVLPPGERTDHAALVALLQATVRGCAKPSSNDAERPALLGDAA